MTIGTLLGVCGLILFLTKKKDEADQSLSEEFFLNSLKQAFGCAGVFLMAGSLMIFAPRVHPAAADFSFLVILPLLWWIFMIFKSEESPALLSFFMLTCFFSASADASLAQLFKDALLIMIGISALTSVLEGLSFRMIFCKVPRVLKGMPLILLAAALLFLSAETFFHF